MTTPSIFMNKFLVDCIGTVVNENYDDYYGPVRLCLLSLVVVLCTGLFAT